MLLHLPLVLPCLCCNYMNTPHPIKLSQRVAYCTWFLWNACYFMCVPDTVYTICFLSRAVIPIWQQDAPLRYHRRYNALTCATVGFLPMIAEVRAGSISCDGVDASYCHPVTGGPSMPICSIQAASLPRFCSCSARTSARLP